MTFATHAGSTAEVARVVGEEIEKKGWQVEVLPIQEVRSLGDYAGVVLGGPMILGYHRSALKFLRAHHRHFQTMPLAVFVMAMSLTHTGENSLRGVPLKIDDKLLKAPVQAGRLNLKERYARISNYARPILRTLRPARPVSLAFFGGRLDYGRLKWWAVLFAMVVIQAPAGERRNWTAIREWAAGLPEAFQQFRA